MGLIIFDLDGTLIRTREKPEYIGRMSQNPKNVSLREQMRKKAIELGFPPLEYEGLNRMALIWNKTRELLSREGYDEVKAKRIMKALNELVTAHEEKADEDCILVPGVNDTLKFLKKRSYKIGLVTNTSRLRVQKIFQRFGFGKYFDYYITRDDVNYLKPNPKPILKILKKFCKKRFHYVGDADHDAEAVKSAGSTFTSSFTLINTRGYDEETIKSISPDAVITSLDELLNVLTMQQPSK